MNPRRPRNVLGLLALTAVLGFATSGLLDHHSDWGDPRQAVANVGWIVFLISLLGFVVFGVRLFLHRRESTPKRVAS
jgi:hypothetical protein